MLDELQLRNLSKAAISAYLGAVTRFAQHFGKSPEQLGPEQVRQYLLHLVNDKKDTWNTVQVYRGALKFLYYWLRRFDHRGVPPFHSGKIQCSM
jgi:hypothetical protein